MKYFCKNWFGAFIYITSFLKFNLYNKKTSKKLNKKLNFFSQKTCLEQLHIPLHYLHLIHINKKTSFIDKILFL